MNFISKLIQSFFCSKNKCEIVVNNQRDITTNNQTKNTKDNPYSTLDDGIYKTTIKDYLLFCRYLDEYIGNGLLLYKRCSNDKVDMYVIKRKGYYGFFVLNLNTGSQKGISIVNGGMTKKITTSIDLQWIFDNFENVISKYLQILTPLRLAEEEISKEIRELGFEGTIHGCIVDIDFYHHIMLNPIDGTITYYYSPKSGIIKILSSFNEVLLSIKEHENVFNGWDCRNFLSSKDFKLITKKINKNKENPDYLLNKADKLYLNVSSDTKADIISIGEQVISMSGGMYSISRRVNSLQRLFTEHVLRDFDLKLCDTFPTLESK